LQPVEVLLNAQLRGASVICRYDHHCRVLLSHCHISLVQDGRTTSL